MGAALDTRWRSPRSSACRPLGGIGSPAPGGVIGMTPEEFGSLKGVEARYARHIRPQSGSRARASVAITLRWAWPVASRLLEAATEV